ncbi:response regulator [Fusibacter paucivorans]|uniref:Stage 0 sporulation protein A homolog n=1 Tax=Fusibacter paucivorans TaxID=76009 RepID=A0ABS5PJF3_9FIRM|nr:ATP-binding protein [Fusibacter paucivorans]MBS7525086.1 response regulator [Fusibacter paucivorans]
MQTNVELEKEGVMNIIVASDGHIVAYDNSAVLNEAAAGDLIWNQLKLLYPNRAPYDTYQLNFRRMIESGLTEIRDAVLTLEMKPATLTYTRLNGENTLILLKLEMLEGISEWALKNIFASIHIPQLLLDDSLLVVAINNAFKRQFHVSDSAVGTGFGDTIRCINTMEDQCGHSNQCKFCTFRKAIQHKVKARETVENMVISMILQPHSEEVWLSINMFPITIKNAVYYLISVENITDQVLADRRIHSARRHSLKLLDELPLLIFQILPNGTCDFLNQTFMQYIPIRRYTFDSVIKQYMATEAYALFHEHLEKGMNAHTVEAVELKMKNPFGEYRTMHCTLKPVFDKGNQFMGIIGMMADIEEHRRLEEALKYEKDRSESANRAKSEFLANMSHEIRTPLNGILGMIDLTLMDELSSTNVDNLKTAKECANNLLGIINDVLDFSKMEAGKLTITPSKFDVREMAKELIRAHQPHAMTKGIELDLVLEEVPKPMLRGDVNRIKQIINNLMSNAIKFTQEGSVTLEITVKETEKSDLAKLSVSVVDTGIGISEDKRDKLFQRFSQIDSTFTREYGGTGLGLVISKQLVMFMNGQIDFISEVGEGTTFFFTIPLIFADTHDEVKKMQSTTAFEEDKRLLIVEDDKVNQIVITKMLENIGLRADVAGDGSEALSFCEKKSYDAILMDIQMPVLDGVQTTKRIRSGTTQNADTTIIALTAYALQDDEALFRKSGMDDYLSKPVSLNILKETLDKHLHMAHKLGRRRIESGGSYRDQRRTATKHRIDVVSHQVNQVFRLYEQQQFDLIEVIVNDMKKGLEALNAESMKTMTFKIALDLRKAQYDMAYEKMQTLRTMFDEFKASVPEVDDDE